MRATGSFLLVLAPSFVTAHEVLDQRLPRIRRPTKGPKSRTTDRVLYAIGPKMDDDSGLFCRYIVVGPLAPQRTLGLPSKATFSVAFVRHQRVSKRVRT